MTTFVESCVETVAGSAQAAARRARTKPNARRLLKLLADKKNILVTTHMHPDPDALASAHAMKILLSSQLKDAAQVTMSIKGRIGGGVNEVFSKLSNLTLVPWDESTLG